MSLARALFACLLALWLALPAAAATPIPDPLGTSRVLAVDTTGGPRLGISQYPQGRLGLEPKEVVLTFDDGPWPVTTAKVLDALAAEGVKATFFVLGQNARARPELLRRELAEGHTVAHHSYSHPHLNRIPAAAAKADIDKGFAAVDTILYGQAGAQPRTPFFRFPYVGDTPELLAWLSARNIGVFGTDIWASDWEQRTPEAQLKLMLDRLEKMGRGMLLFHDTKERTAAMLPDFLRELKRRGYRVVHIVPKQ